MSDQFDVVPTLTLDPMEEQPAQTTAVQHSHSPLHKQFLMRACLPQRNARWWMILQIKLN